MGENKTHKQPNTPSNNHQNNTTTKTPRNQNRRGGEPETTGKICSLSCFTHSNWCEDHCTAPGRDRNAGPDETGTLHKTPTLRAHHTPISKQVTSKRGNQTNYTERLSVCGTCCHPAQDTQTDASRHPFPCL